MSLIPWKTASTIPVRHSNSKMGEGLASFERDINNLMGNFFNRGNLRTPIMSFDEDFALSFYPSIDVNEKDDKYLLDADMPGIHEGDIDLDFHNNILTIKGERKSETETKDVGRVCVERSYGAFRRDIAFDNDIDQEKIKAEFKAGVLHVELAKKEKSKLNHRKIEIK